MIKINRYLLVFSLLFLSSNSYSMKRTYEEANPTEAYFVPTDDVIGKLFSFLDKAQNRLLVAMYWITDDSILDKLISLKKNGINVEIIMDQESLSTFSLDYKSFIDKLTGNNIIPIIYPSDVEGSGKMHNKYLVVDGAHVFTGSANFTKKALNLGQTVNYENIVIIHSRDIALRFEKDFNNIKDNSYNLYIQIIARNNMNEIPDWFKYLIPKIPQDVLNEAREGLWKDFNWPEKRRLESFFRLEPEIQRTSQKPISGYQFRELISHGYSPSEISGISYNDAYKLIGMLR